VNDGDATYLAGGWQQADVATDSQAGTPAGWHSEHSLFFLAPRQSPVAANVVFDLNGERKVCSQKTDKPKQWKIMTSLNSDPACTGGSQ
jgi:hypothetical protein